MSYEQITTELAEGILTITLNRPERLNAWTAVMGRELIEAFDRADADDDVRAIIMTGAGRGYCAGADLAAGGETFDYAARAAEGSLLTEPVGGVPRDNGGQFTLRIFACTKPVIGAINGPAVGVGATMTLPMDVRLASDDARMGFVFARRGIVPEACSSWFLPRVVGISRAMEWVSTGRVFSAQEGLDAGLLRSLHSSEELLPAARALAHRDRREHRARVRRARAADDVADARRRASDARPPRRLARDARARAVRRRNRGDHLVSREAPRALLRPRQRRAARDHALVGRARVRVSPRAGAAAAAQGACWKIALRGTCRRGTPSPSQSRTHGSYTGRKPSSSGIVTTR